MIEGISVKENIKLGERQAIWNAGARICYTELRANSCVRSVMNDCEYMGIAFGGLWKLRYFPGAGLGDSQAFDFAAALSQLPYATLPPVVELCRDDGVLPETRAYRENLKQFITRFYAHSGGRVAILKLTRSLAEWLEPDDFLLNHSAEHGLWIHEPKSTEISIGKFKYWTLRSFAERSVGGTSVEWIQIPATKAQFDNWALKGGVLRFLVNGGTTPQEPPPPVLTDAEKLAKVRGLVGQLVEILK